MAPIEIVFLVLGILAIVASFLVKEKKNEQEKFTEDEIKLLVNKEYENTQYKMKEASEAAVAEAKEKAERSLEKITNEKMLALGEYSDSIINQISKNHQETVFLYDMLTKNKDELAISIAEAKNNTQEATDLAKQAVSSAKEAKDISDVALLNATESMKKNALAEESMIRARQVMESPEKEPVVVRKEVVKDVVASAMPEAMESAEDEYIEDKPEVASLVDRSGEGIRLVDRGEEPEEAVVSDDSKENRTEQVPEQEVTIEDAVIMEDNQELEETLKTAVLEELGTAKERSAYEEVQEILGNVEDEPKEKKVESIKDLINKTNAVQEERKSMNENSIKAVIQKNTESTSFQFHDKKSGDDTNNKIMKLHKLGKSNMAIAKEMGLGVGEVNLVIGLYDHE